MPILRELVEIVFRRDEPTAVARKSFDEEFKSSIPDKELQTWPSSVKRGPLLGRRLGHEH